MGEVVDGLVALIDNPELDIVELTEYIKAPDFPTGGIIYGMSGVLDAYQTGRGHLRIRAKADIEEDKTGRETIIIKEIPYMVNKTTLLEKMADLVREKRIEGISNIQDESDRDGLRIVVELKRDVVGDVILNQLYKTHPVGIDICGQYGRAGQWSAPTSDLEAHVTVLYRPPPRCRETTHGIRTARR